MKSKIVFKLLTVAISLFLSFNIQAQTQHLSLNVETPGTLSSLVTNKKYSTSLLTVSGSLNGTDLRFIREMAGSAVDGSKTIGNLEYLDLTDANIVKGGEKYYSDLITLDNEIGRYTFRGCSALTTVRLPKSATKISHGAFENCTSLTSVTIPDSYTSIGDDAFANCTRLFNITIPNSVTSIGNRAFYGCWILNVMRIPDSVISIGEMAFEGCASLKLFVVSDEHEVFTVIDSALFIKDSTILLKCPEGMPRDYVIPETVTSIGNDAFFGCRYIDTVIVPIGVSYIGGRAFEECTRLKYIEIPHTVQSIGAAFYNCRSLNEIYNMNKTPQGIDMFCFTGVNKNVCILYVPEGSREAYRNAPYWKDFRNIVETKSTSNNFISDKSISISNISNGIFIKTEKMENISIYSILGQKIYESKIQGETNINTGKGIYIVVVGNKSQKIVVR